MNKAASAKERQVEELTPDEARTIWMHVLHKAVEDYQNGKNAKGRESKRAFREAEKWIWSDSAEFPSFVSLCELFELNPSTIRRRLKDVKKLHLVGASPGSSTGVVGSELCSPWLERAEGRRAEMDYDEEPIGESTDL